MNEKSLEIGQQDLGFPACTSCEYCRKLTDDGTVTLTWKFWRCMRPTGPRRVITNPVTGICQLESELSYRSCEIEREPRIGNEDRCGPEGKHHKLQRQSYIPPGVKRPKYEDVYGDELAKDNPERQTK